MDLEACAEAVQAFRDACSRYNDRHEHLRDQDDAHEVLERMLQVKQIAAHFGIGAPEDYTDDAEPPFRFSRAERSSSRLLGYLKTLEATEKMLGPYGPSLDASRFHPWVWGAAVNLWHGGHYRQAVQDAYTAVETQARVKTLPEVTGEAIWRVFNVQGEDNEVRLRLPEIDRDSDPSNWKTFHDGIAFVGKGCAGAMRNLAAHSTKPFEEQEALEQLGALSYLARLVDRSEVASPE